MDDCFHAVVDHGARTLVFRVFDQPLVEINEKPGWDESGFCLLLHPLELVGGANGIGGATAELAMVVDRRAFGAEVHRFRKFDGRRGEKKVSLVG